MALLNFIDRVVIPAVVIVLLVGGIGGVILGCALVFRSSATLRFMTRMNSWVSTRQALKPLEVSYHIEPAAGPGGRRPLLGSFLVVGGALAVYFLLARLDFVRGPYVPGISVIRWFLSGVALEAMKWTLVVGSAFASVIGLAMLLAPERLMSFEARVNHWYSSRRLMSADEKMHMPLEPHVEAYPRAAGWTIAAASLLVTFAMGGLLVARLHQLGF
jgi:hypothetical protein